MKFLIIFAALLAATYATSHHGDNGGHYKFEYGVSDPHTGDKKSQYEHRDGHVVKGAYTLKEADGTLRVVEYIAEPHKGFNAVVKRIGHAHHPAHYGNHGHGHGGHGGHGGHAGHGGHGGDSFVGVTHWGYQGPAGHHH